ncbi:MAG TPA: exodeoxyribonuclease VII small subunit [Verrucomicrobiales bacterium]|nr:exodeoxyribonuclease VII small subunit [Verrucomicrobiales bacterium]
MARPTRKTQEEDLSFEQALARLEELVESLDSDELALEDLVRRYGEGMNLLKHCQGQLENARQRIETIGAEFSEEEAGEEEEGDVSEGIDGGAALAPGHNDDEIRLF